MNNSKCDLFLVMLIFICAQLCCGALLKKRIAIVGAGPGGLIALKYALDAGYNCDVFEQTGSVGGTWVYTNYTDLDEYGLPVHSGMYQNLSTNVPKEIMAFPNFPYPEQEKSYISQPEVLDYFKNFTNHYDLLKNIKFHKYVFKVQPFKYNKWNVTVLDAKTKLKESKFYDAVFVCNGHYTKAFIPQIPNQELYKGKQIHSHKYRTPNLFKNKKVLIIGAGPSGIDISVKVAEVAKTVFVSRRHPIAFPGKPSNVIEKPHINKFSKNGARFTDDSEEEFDIVVYCTGYRYAFPFLSNDSGITVSDNYVYPLYKHIVNVEHPSMFFMGIPYNVVSMPMLDLQARFALAAIGNKFKLPPKADMLEELVKAEIERDELSIPQRSAHMMRDYGSQKEYYQNLSNLAGIENIPEVLLNIQKDVKMNGKNSTISYVILNDDSFVKYANS